MKKTQRFTVLTGIFAAAAIAGVANANDYVLTPLGDLPGGDFFSRAYDINDHGVIVGSSKDLFDDVRQSAVRWMPGGDPEVLTGLGDFDFSRAQGINNNGSIGGFRDTLDDRRRVWVWDDDNGLDFFLGDVGSEDIRFSRFGGITDNEVVIGHLHFDDPDGTRGYTFERDSESLSILEPIGNGNQSLGLDMNEHGLGAGSASELPGDKPFRDAVAWSTGAVNPNVLPGLGDFAGYEETSAAHVTDSGLIIGSAGNRDDEGILFAQNENFVWSPSTQSGSSMGFFDDYDWTKVGAVSEDGSFAVGFAYDDGQHKPEFISEHVGTVWTPAGGWMNVNDMIMDGPDGYTVVELAGMNAYGDIVGVAINADGFEEAVLLSPVCLTLAVDNLVADETAIITVENGTPGERTVVLAGFGGEPTTFFDAKGWCATFGFDARLKKSKVKISGTGIFDGDGRYSRKIAVRSQFQGREVIFQAAEHGTCPDECMSNIVEEVVQ